MKKKLLPIALLAVLGISVLAGCGKKEPDPGPGPGPVQPDVVNVTGVSLDVTSKTLKVGETHKLVATVAPENATNKAVTWKSDDTDVVTVASDGTVTAVGIGAAVVTVKTADGNKTATCAFTVEMEITSIAISNKAAFEGFAEKQAKELELAIEPAVNVQELIAAEALVVTSSDPTVASISGLLVSGLKAGTTTITVSLFGKTDSFELTVEREKTAIDLYQTVHAGTEDDPLDNADACKIGQWTTETGHDKTTKESFYIKGVIAEWYHFPGERVEAYMGEKADNATSWYMQKGTGDEKAFEVYKCTNADSSTLTVNDVWPGAEVLVKGKITNYSSSGSVTYETSAAEFIRVTGGEERVAPVEHESNVANAITVAKALSDGNTTWDTYKVTGYVVSASGKDFLMADSKTETEPSKMLTIYQPNLEALLGEGGKLNYQAKITVSARLKNYHSTYETNVLTAIELDATETGGEWPNIPEEVVKDKKLADLFADESGNKKQGYEVTGVVTKWYSGSDGGDYGNFYMRDVDGETEYLIYGATSTAKALEWSNIAGQYIFTNPKDFKKNNTTKAIEIGSYVTMKLTRCDYTKNGVTTPEACGIVLKVEEAPKTDIEFGEEYSWNPATSQSDIPGTVLTAPDAWYYWYAKEASWSPSSHTVVTLGDHYIQSGKVHLSYTAVEGGALDHGFQAFYRNSHLEAGKQYKVSVKIQAEKACTVKISAGGGNVGEFELAAGVEKTITSNPFVESADRANFNLVVPVAPGVANSFILSDLKYEEYVEPVGTEVTTTIVASQAGVANQAAIGTLKLDEVISVTGDKGTGNNGVKYFDNGASFRAYGGATLTFAAASGYKMSKIVLTFGSGENDNAITADVGTFATDTWTGDAASVVLSIGGTSGHRRIASIAVTYDVAAETPVEKAEPIGNFSGYAIVNEQNIYTHVALGHELAYVEIYFAKDNENNVKTQVAYTYNKESGLVTIALGGIYGNFTATYDEENQKLVSGSFDGSGAALVSNNGQIQLANAAKFWDCNGTTEELKGIFERRYGSTWTVDTTNNDKIASVQDGIAGSGMKVRAWNGGRYALYLKNDLEPAVYKGIGFWVYNSGTKDVKLDIFCYRAASTNGMPNAGSGDTGYTNPGSVTAKAGGWTYCRLGFYADWTIYNFQILDNTNTGTYLVYDNICLYK